MKMHWFGVSLLGVVLIVLIAATAIKAAPAQLPFPAPTPNERLGVVVTVVTGRTIKVLCEPRLHPNVWGWYSRVPRSVTLSEVRCRQLNALASGFRPRAKAKQDFAEALGILMSGANSASGLGGGSVWGDDATAIASCKAVQQLAKAARELGVGRGYARSLAKSFAHRGYWSVSLLFPTSDCYPGGPMDFNLGESWPNPQPAPPGWGKGGVG